MVDTVTCAPSESQVSPTLFYLLFFSLFHFLEPKSWPVKPQKSYRRELKILDGESVTERNSDKSWFLEGIRGGSV